MISTKEITTYPASVATIAKMLHAANKITQQYKHTIKLVNMHHFSTGCLLVFVPYQAHTGWRQQIFRLQQSYTVIIFLTQTCVMCTTKYFSLHYIQTRDTYT